MKKTVVAAVLLSCFLTGAATQRFYGLGNLVSLKQIEGQPEPPDLTGKRCAVFLLAGQSNMEGTGALEGYAPPPRQYAERIFAVDRKYRLIAAREPMVKSGVGPAVEFAAEYLKRMADPELNVVLVQAAWGGSKIVEWQPSRKESSLYQRAVRRALSASAYGPITGLLWFQGEGDTESDPRDRPDDWDEHFERLCESFRADLGDVRIVYAQIGKNRPESIKVREAQSRVELDNSAMVNFDDLPYAKGCHYSTAGYLEIGRRFAEAMARSD